MPRFFRQKSCNDGRCAGVDSYRLGLSTCTSALRYVPHQICACLGYTAQCATGSPGREMFRRRDELKSGFAASCVVPAHAVDVSCMHHEVACFTKRRSTVRGSLKRSGVKKRRKECASR